MNTEKLEEMLLKALNDISTLKAKVNELNLEFENFKKESSGTGVYLDGCPDYAKEYIVSKMEHKKEGE